jgi:hypothetical protein
VCQLPEFDAAGTRVPLTGPEMPVIAAQRPDLVQAMQWCSVPPWAKDPKVFAKEGIVGALPFQCSRNGEKNR